jgi:hypothetical protein
MLRLVAQAATGIELCHRSQRLIHGRHLRVGTVHIAAKSSVAKVAPHDGQERTTSGAGRIRWSKR